MRWWVLICMMLVAACDPLPVSVSPPIPTPAMNTSWGVPSTLTWATTFDPPALFTDGAETVLGAFERHNDVLVLTIYRGGVRTRSNIAARQPHALTLFPAAMRGTLALWLDDDGTGSQRLFVARLNDTGFSERGSVAVSSGPAIRYAAAALHDGTLWAIWSVPNAGESTLVGSRLDDEGRARSPEALRVDADFPALAVTNAGNVLLFWLEGAQRNLYRGELTQAGLALVTRLATEPWLSASADHLIRLEVGIDTTHTYIFWQALSSSGSNEVWYTSGPLSETAVDGARQLRVSTTDTQEQTGFNHGVAYTAERTGSENVVEFASPAVDQNETLPVSVLSGHDLGLVYFRGGDAFAAQTIGTLERRLIAPPKVAADDERDLWLAWWLPDTVQEAVLYLIESGR
jgi:hypothetical protein